MKNIINLLKIVFTILALSFVCYINSNDRIIELNIFAVDKSVDGTYHRSVCDVCGLVNGTNEAHVWGSYSIPNISNVLFAVT